MSRIDYLAGVDGGGSGCRAVLADLSGRVIGRGEAGPANATTDEALAVRNTRAALEAAAARAALGPEVLGRTFVVAGLAGVQAAKVARRVAEALSVGRADVCEDRDIALIGALGDRDGVLAAVGTGSTLAARRGGQVRHLGGWGFQLGDQASGAWLGRALLEQVLLAQEGMAEQGPLAREVLKDMGGPLALVSFGLTATARDYAALAPRIVAAADAGEAMARRLMGRGAAYLAQAIATLGLAQSEALCLTGGLGPQYAPYLPADQQARIAEPAGDALGGALVRARELWEGAE